MELETDPLFWPRRQVNTLTGVIHRIFEEDIKPEKYPDYSPVDQILKQMLIKKALINRSRAPDGLAYFNSLFPKDDTDKDYPGIFRNISGFFSELYRNNYEDIYASDLGGKIFRQEEIKPGSGDENYPLESDLIWLMGEYEELKREIGGYDEDDVFRNVLDYLKDNQTSEYISGFNVIILDSLTHISRIEEEILFCLINSVEELWWLVDFDSSAQDPLPEFRKSCGLKGKSDTCHIYYSLVSLMDRLHEKGAEYKVETADRAAYPNPFAGALFTNTNMDMDAGTDTLKIGTFPGEVDEVRAIASEIKRILYEEGPDGHMSPGDIRVIFPDLNDYASLVSEIFTEHGIPFSLTKGIPLSSHPLSHIFLKVFQLPLEGFMREDLFGIFSLKILDTGFFRFELPAFSLDMFSDDQYLPGDTSEGLENLFDTGARGKNINKPDICLFDTVMKRCGIGFLGKELENIGEDRIPAYRDIYHDLIKDTRNSEEKKSLKLEYYLFLYQRIIFYLVLEPFTALMNCKMPEKIREVFEGLIHLLGFPLNIMEVNNRNIGLDPDAKRVLLKRDIRSYTLLNELLNISHREVNLARRLFNIEKSDILLSAFFKTFTARINNKYLLDERNPDVVRVSQWLETRGRTFEYVFAGGLTAGRFPLRDEPDFIIPESSRGIFRIMDPIVYSKHLFSNLLKNYRKRLYLSYPENISEKPVQPSQVIQDLLALNKGEKSSQDLSWSRNPFYTSENELLNAVKNKNSTGEENIYPFNLKGIIIRDTDPEEDIIRGLKALISRSAGNGLFEYDGNAETAFGFKEYTRERNRIFSSSSLETLANCPMKYLFEYVYKIRDPDEVTREASSRDVGQLVHDALSMLYKELAVLKTNIAGLGLEKASAMAGEIFERCLEKRAVMERLDFGEFYKQELFSGLLSKEGTEEIKDSRGGIISALLGFENTEFINRIPEGVEFEFGPPDRSVPLGNLFIRGYIDRYDRDIDCPGTVYIYDYKTGSIKSASNIKKGLAFQLPVYIRALESVVNPREIAAAFYSLNRNAFVENSPLKSQVVNCSSGSGLDINGVTLIDEFTTHLAGLIEKGIFHHSADGLICEYCQFRYACHKNERRMEYLLEACPGLDIYSGSRNLARWQVADTFKKEWKSVCKSMEKAETLKTAPGRRRHYEAVVEFYNDLEQRGGSIPFTSEYVDSLRHELYRFLCRYDSLYPEDH